MGNAKQPLGSPAGEEPESCAAWEAALADLLDGTLAPEAEAAFARHAEGCENCRVLLEQCRAGQGWARLLHAERPPVPPALLGKILARTAAEAPQLFPGQPALPYPSLLPAGDLFQMPPAVWSHRSQHQARLLMTAAMAFFSLALTLSFTGNPVPEMRAALKNTSALPMTATRQFFATKKQVVSFYDNLRLVREMELTVEDLRQSTAPKPAAAGKSLQPSARRSLAAPVLLPARLLFTSFAERLPR